LQRELATLRAEVAVEKRVSEVCDRLERLEAGRARLALGWLIASAFWQACPTRA
jgi:hypothetical protein